MLNMGAIKSKGLRDIPFNFQGGGMHGFFSKKIF
jgi:hypothetical protein